MYFITVLAWAFYDDSSWKMTGATFWIIIYSVSCILWQPIKSVSWILKFTVFALSAWPAIKSIWKIICSWLKIILRSFQRFPDCLQTRECVIQSQFDVKAVIVKCFLTSFKLNERCKTYAVTNDDKMPLESDPLQLFCFDQMSDFEEMVCHRFHTTEGILWHTNQNIHKLIGKGQDNRCVGFGRKPRLPKSFRLTPSSSK